MAAAKRSAGVVPEVNLRYPLHAGKKTHKWGDPPWLRNQGQISLEIGVSVAPQNNLCRPKFTKKRKKEKMGITTNTKCLLFHNQFMWEIVG